MYSGALMSAKLRQAAMAAAGPALPHRSETLKPRRSQARRQWSIQAVKGKVTTRCLWNACKALTVGVLLILVGAAMATIGYYAEEEQLRLQALADADDGTDDEPVVMDKMTPTHMFPLPPLYSSGRKAASNSSTGSNTTSTVSTIHSDNVTTNDTTSSRPKMGHIFTKDSGFGLNKLSYVGPIVMGFGGFVIVAACVMTFEARDSAAKIVPARFRKPYLERSNGRDEEGGVRHSACQTKWEALSLCHHSQQDGASPAAEDPQRSELSRRAMTFAFIQFSKTLQTSIDSSAEYYDGRRGSRPQLAKCPSAPSLVPPFQKTERRLAEPPRVLRVATRPSQPSTASPKPSLTPNSLPRQAMSVDNPAVREVYAATAYPAFIGTRGEEEMELGASATGVHETGSGSQGSLALDLHLPESCPVTLAVRDQSRSPSNPREESPKPLLPGLKVDKQTSTSDHLNLSLLGTSRDTWGSRDMACPSSRVTSGGSFRESRRPRPSRRVRRSETIDTASVAASSRRSHHQRHLSTTSARSSSSRNGAGGAVHGGGERRLQPSRSETARRHQFLRQHKVETGGSQEDIPTLSHCHHPL